MKFKNYIVEAKNKGISNLEDLKNVIQFRFPELKITPSAMVEIDLMDREAAKINKNAIIASSEDRNFIFNYKIYMGPYGYYYLEERRAGIIKIFKFKGK